MKAHALLLSISAACVGGDDQTSEQLALNAPQRGVDYSWSRPSPQKLVDGGYTFAARYLSYDHTGKNLTASEMNGLFAVGIDVVANWEWNAGDALLGYNTGRTQALQAQLMTSQLGMPSDRPIYFSVDIDATEGQQAAIDAYFDGVISVLGVEHTGAYGGYYVIKRLFDHGKIAWGWQTYAWSGGQWDVRAQLRQIQNGAWVAGVQLDIDQSMVADFGQWGPHAASTSPEGTRVYLTPGQQHLTAVDPTGALRHVRWDAATNAFARTTLGTNLVGQPATFALGNEQHAFARGAAGTLEHWYWTANGAPAHTTWATGLAADPAVALIGSYQHAWAVDGAGALQHWFWGLNTSGVKHDTWASGVAGRPSVFVYRGQQHVFVRGTGGTLEHVWWDPSGSTSHDTWASGLASDPVVLSIGDVQHVWAIDTAGQLKHWSWSPTSGGVHAETWGAGVVGRPSAIAVGAEQHVFARGVAGTVEHFWSNGSVAHDTWGSGITSDPTGELVGSQQHVWAQDAAGDNQHWFRDPAANTSAHDSWGK